MKSTKEENSLNENFDDIQDDTDGRDDSPYKFG
jgi:hypothetical protein